MNRSKHKYHEQLLHWIWANRQYNFHNLRDNEGMSITVHNSGRPNQSDGPDFRGAEITIGRLRWYGDVEIHWQLSDWKSHGHSGDPHFKQVILHVVFDETDKTICRKDGSSIPTLCLAPFIDPPLKSFLTQYRRKPALPCSDQFSFISEEAFASQLRKAHKEYFEQKVNDLLDFYDAQLPPSKAWLKMFVTALFDGLGISHNRFPMRTLAVRLLPLACEAETKAELRELAIAISGLNAAADPPFAAWRHKGMRPGNHPAARIRQGADCLWFIVRQPFDRWLKVHPETLWKEMTGSVEATPSVGRERSSILFGTVFLPALYSLGNVFFSEQRRTISWRLWQDHSARIPSSLLQLLDETDLSPELYKHKLGAIYQIRHYCERKNCQNCKVFKSAISS